MKGWYGNSQKHSLASRGIKVSDLKYIGHPYKFEPYSSGSEFYNWLCTERGWDKQDALDYIGYISEDREEEARKIIDTKYAFKNTMDAFPNADKDVTSEVYYMTRMKDNELGESWTRNYGYAGYIWDNPENLDEKGLKWQKEALESLDLDGKSHTKLGEVPFDEPNKIYHHMQGDNWSPLGEARQLVRSKGTHTSMSIGDIIKTPDGKTLIVAGMGFLDIDDLKRRHGI